VLLLVDIGKNGKISALSVVSGPQELVQSGVDAIEHWRYRPFLINGEPAVVQTDIRVNFVLRR
jgi:protein TonB